MYLICFAYISKLYTDKGRLCLRRGDITCILREWSSTWERSECKVAAYEPNLEAINIELAYLII